MTDKTEPVTISAIAGLFQRSQTHAMNEAIHIALELDKALARIQQLTIELEAAKAKK